MSNEIDCPTCGFTGEPKTNSRGQVRCASCYALINTAPLTISDVDVIEPPAEIKIPDGVTAIESGGTITLHVTEKNGEVVKIEKPEPIAIDESDGIDEDEASAAGRALRQAPRKPATKTKKGK